MSAHRKWTEEMDAALQGCRAQGLTRPQIAERMGLTEAAIRKRLATLSGATRHWTPEEEAALLEMREEGQRWSEIGQVFGRTAEGCRSRWFKVTGDLKRTVSEDLPSQGEVSGGLNRIAQQEACENHLQALLKANPRGFLAFSESRFGPGKVAVCAPLFHPLKRAA